MEVGNRCGVRCFHKSVQCFFSPEVGILKLVEKIWFSWLIICLPSKKCRLTFWDIWNLLLFFTFFPKKTGGFALWKLCALGSCQAFGRCATEASTGQWCWQLVFGSWHWSSATTSTSGEGDLTAAQFLGRSFCMKMKGAKMRCFFWQHVSEVTILHDEFPPRIKNKQQTTPYFWLNLQISDPKVYVLWVTGAYVFPMKILWQIMVLAAWFILYLAIVIPAFWPIAARLRLFDLTGLEGYWPWRMA